MRAFARKPAFEGHLPTRSDRVASRLPAGTPGDRFELEADRVADELVGRGIAPGPSRQRTSERTGHGGDGTRVPESVRALVEPYLGFDFGKVRIHTDAEAARLSHDIGARAATRGAHVYFAPGEYDPRGQPGRHLLVHELAHVVQQARPRTTGTGPPRGAIQRQPKKKPDPALAGVERLIAADRGRFGIRAPFKQALLDFLNDGLNAVSKPSTRSRQFMDSLKNLLTQLIDDLKSNRIKVDFGTVGVAQFAAEYDPATNTIRLPMPQIGLQQNLLTQPHKHVGPGVDLGPMLERNAVETFKRRLPELSLQLVHEYQHLLDDRIKEQAVLGLGARKETTQVAYARESTAFRQEAYLATTLKLKPPTANFLNKVFKMFEDSVSQSKTRAERSAARRSISKTAQQNYRKHYGGSYPRWALRVTIADDASVKLFIPNVQSKGGGRDVGLGKLVAVPASPEDLRDELVKMLEKLPKAQLTEFKALGALEVVVFRGAKKVPVEFAFSANP
jgi:hypothetical protein